MGMLPTLQPGLLLGRCPALPPQLLASGGVPGRHAAACAGDATAPQPIGNRVFPHVCAARAYACEPGAKLGAGTDAQLPVDACDLAQPLRDRILNEAPRHRRSHPQPVRRVRPCQPPTPSARRSPRPATNPVRPGIAPDGPSPRRKYSGSGQRSTECSSLTVNPLSERGSWTFRVPGLRSTASRPGVTACFVAVRRTERQPSPRRNPRH